MPNSSPPRFFAVGLIAFGALVIAMGVSMWPPPEPSKSPRAGVAAHRELQSPALVPLALVFAFGGSALMAGIVSLINGSPRR